MDDSDVPVSLSAVRNEPPSCGMLTVADTYIYMDSENMWGFSVASSQFYYELETFLKNKLYLSKKMIIDRQMIISQIIDDN